jgi:excisionase family DNA binding protein
MSGKTGRLNVRRTAIRQLATHPSPYVTVGELAEYWAVNRKQIYKHIEAGTLRAIRLGPRLLRIRTSDAQDFELRAKMTPADDSNHREE